MSFLSAYHKQCAFIHSLGDIFRVCAALMPTDPGIYLHSLPARQTCTTRGSLVFIAKESIAPVHDEAVNQISAAV